MSGPVRPVRGGIPWLVVIGVLVAALSLRGPIVAVTPVLREIERDLGIGSAAAGLMTTAPVLMFAVLTPLAALLIRRAGADLALMISLCGVLVGTVVRALPGFGWMLAGMVVIGAAVTVGNVVIPVIIRREVPPERVALVTASYAATLNVGSLLTSLLTAPLAAAIGWSWALLVWSAITLAGVAVWGVHLRRVGGLGDRFSGDAGRGGHPGDGAEAVMHASTSSIDPATITGPLPTIDLGRRPALLRRPVTWLLVAAFGGQTTIYYALSTWLPTFAADELALTPASAGAVASLYQGVGIVGAFVVPLLARFAPRPVAPITICVTWLVLTVGLLAAPELLWLWLSIGAIGHAGGFVVIFSAMVAVARDDREAATMSALVQGGGYTLGALGGPLLGGLYELTGGWATGLVVLLILAIAYCAALLAASALAARAER
ncbi:MFS transporter [Microbacterium hominis]|uniref:MFS transporter n=1 Tax=Microbacterium hominis TaxID=162426 RepID=A0A7D4QIV0_9MICO|nr:MFS transporter [Microbacterium hominis]QKJ19636.1 MFS transporter [Microbacterium hominis]